MFDFVLNVCLTVTNYHKLYISINSFDVKRQTHIL